MADVERPLSLRTRQSRAYRAPRAGSEAHRLTRTEAPKLLLRRWRPSFVLALTARQRPADAALDPRSIPARPSLATLARTVTDDLGASGTTRTVSVTAPATGITLTARGSKVRWSARVNLTWTGATGATVDLYRNGTKVAAPSNTGAYTDVLAKVTGTLIYKVCNAGTSPCSPNASVTF